MFFLISWHQVDYNSRLGPKQTSLCATLDFVDVGSDPGTRYEHHSLPLFKISLPRVFVS